MAQEIKGTPQQQDLPELINDMIKISMEDPEVLEPSHAREHPKTQERREKYKEYDECMKQIRSYMNRIPYI